MMSRRAFPVICVLTACLGHSAARGMVQTWEDPGARDGGLTWHQFDQAIENLGDDRYVVRRRAAGLLVRRATADVLSRLYRL